MNQPVIRPTLRTIARLLTPWRTIRRLEADNHRLESSLDKSMLQIDRLRQQAVLRAQINSERLNLIQLQHENLVTAGEALWRLRKHGWNGVIAQPVYDWVRDGMIGPLPPLPDLGEQTERHIIADEPFDELLDFLQQDAATPPPKNH